LKRSKKEVQPNWHPNFRIQSELPDIKPIRTGFIINFVAVIVCIGLAALLVQQELKRMSLKESNSQLSGIVEDSRTTNQAYLKKSRDFASEVKPLQELENFYSSPILIYDFLIRLTEVRPDDLIYDTVNFTESNRMERRRQITSYRLQINGKTRDLATLGNFKSSIAELDFIEKYNGQVNETILTRDEATGVFPFNLVVDLSLE